MTLDLSSLDQSIDSLKRALHVSDQNTKNLSSDLTETLRAGVIQNFEVTYELCWKFMQRWIRTNKTPEDVDLLRTRKDLFRMAAKYELINNPEVWFDYGNARNLTSHTYNKTQADVIYSLAHSFLNDAQYLLKQLELRND